MGRLRSSEGWSYSWREAFLGPGGVAGVCGTNSHLSSFRVLPRKLKLLRLKSTNTPPVLQATDQPTAPPPRNAIAPRGPLRIPEGPTTHIRLSLCDKYIKYRLTLHDSPSSCLSDRIYILRGTESLHTRHSVYLRNVFSRVGTFFRVGTSFHVTCIGRNCFGDRASDQGGRPTLNPFTLSTSRSQRSTLRFPPPKFNFSP